MELTASRVRAAGWLPLLYFGLSIIVFAVTWEMTTSSVGEPPGAFKNILSNLNLLLSTALNIYVLVVFRQLLNERYAYTELDKTIGFIIYVNIFNACWPWSFLSDLPAFFAIFVVFGASIYFATISIRMFFMAALVLKGSTLPQALTQG